MDEEVLKHLYYQMIRIRLVEEKIAEHYPEKEIRCPVHLCIGQEAVAVGVCATLSFQDYVLSNHRSHGHYLAKGGNLRAMIAELYGRVTGCSQGKGGSMHLVDLSAGFLGATPIVGSTIPIAVGVAFGSMMKGESRVTAVFFGDAATEEGVFHESLNFARLKKLPILFVCENNFYSVYSPLAVRQPKGREIIRLAEGHSIEAWQGDGNDVIEVYEMARRSVMKIKQGEGPIFLEFKTYRWREHCGPNYDNELGYRSIEEFHEWKKRDPIEKLGNYLMERGKIQKSDVDELIRNIEGEVKSAIEFAKRSSFPEKQALLDHVYAPNGKREVKFYGKNTKIFSSN